MPTVSADESARRGPAAIPAGDGVWAPHRRRLTLGLVLTITLVAFESLAISTVMPVVADDLGHLGLYGWVFSGFFLGSLLGIVTAGQAADRRGTAFPFAVGLVLFSIGLLLGGLAPSMPLLVAGRVAQGVGAGAIPAVAYATVGRAYPALMRPRVFAVFSSAWVIPGLIGPAAASAIEHALSWRAVFLALLPLVALAAAIAIPALSHSGPAAGSTRGVVRPSPALAGPAADAASVPTVGTAEQEVVPHAIGGEAAAAGGGGEAAAALGPDQRGTAVVLTVGVAAVLIAANGIVLPLAVALLAVGGPLAVVAFVRLVPPGTLRLAPGVPAAVMVRGILTFAFFGTDAYVSLTFSDVRNQPIWVAGVALTGATMAWTAASWVQERWVHRVGPRRLVIIGFACVGVGILGMLGAQGPLSIWASIAVWAVAGFGIGLSYSPLSVTVLDLAQPGREGSAAASLQLTDVLGTALGTGASGALVALGEGQGWLTSSALTIAFVMTLLVALAGIVASRRLPTALAP